jgi:hypothetical protein
VAVESAESELPSGSLNDDLSPPEAKRAQKETAANMAATEAASEAGSLSFFAYYKGIRTGSYININRSIYMMCVCCS